MVKRFIDASVHRDMQNSDTRIDTRGAVSIRFYSHSDSGFCVRYIRLSRLQNDIFKAHFIGFAKTLYPGVQLLGLWRKILPTVARFRLM